ncbi:hypothetical protein [Agrobacterium tumefaciens]|nr:hypothetical protein [Agrobacterium tumefaciens]MDS7594041.1 hypothetical protein [Agrobacterium tumefaciens]
MRKKPQQEVVSGREARQGWLGRPVLVVLISSLILAGMVWLGIEAWWS